MIRVLIAEDQSMIRKALVALLGLEGDIEVVTEVARGDEIVDQVERSTPDVALLDIELPGLDGLAAAAQLRVRCQKINQPFRRLGRAPQRAQYLPHRLLRGAAQVQNGSFVSPSPKSHRSSFLPADNGSRTGY